MYSLKQEKLLYLVTDSFLCGSRSLEEVVDSAIRGGVNIVQLREKEASQDDVFSIGKKVKSVCELHNVPFIINDDVDVALALDADGVHVGQSDCSYEIARKKMGSGKIIGLSVNNLDQVKEAEGLDVDYLGIGPIFPTSTKLDAGNLWKMDELRCVRELSSHILVGIGGINYQNARSVIENGFDGIAVISAICSADCPKDSAIKLFEEIVV